ncbi:hypothetical protein FQZ97_681740 [compost metagenome]
MRLLQDCQIELFLVILIPQSFDTHLCASRVENPHHDLLAPKGGQGVDAKVNGFHLGNLHLDPAILRLAAFGDIQSGHYLQAGSDATGQLDWWFGDLM